MKRIVLLVLVPAMLVEFGCFTLPKPVVLGKELPELKEVKGKLEQILMKEFRSKQESDFKDDVRQEIRALYDKNSNNMKALMKEALGSDKIQDLFAEQLKEYYEGMTKDQALLLIEEVINEHYILDLDGMDEDAANKFARPFLSLLEDKSVF